MARFGEPRLACAVGIGRLIYADERLVNRVSQFFGVRVYDATTFHTRRAQTPEQHSIGPGISRVVFVSGTLEPLGLIGLAVFHRDFGAAGSYRQAVDVETALLAPLFAPLLKEAPRHLKAVHRASLVLGPC